MKNAPGNLSAWIDRLSPRVKNLVVPLWSLLAGLAVALMLHYLLYRIELPSKPFIYVAF